MDMRQFTYFLLVAEAESFSGAAARARIAQPALSRKVRQLEDELGTKLFVRHKRGVALTEEGARFRDRLEDVMRQLHQLHDDTASSASEPRGRIVIGMPPSMRTMLTGEVIHQYSKAYPQVQMRIAEGVSVSLREMVSTGLADLAVITSQEPMRELNREPLCEERLYLLGPNDLGLAADRKVPLNFLAGKSLVMTSFPNGLRMLVEGELSRARIGVTVRYEVNSVPLIIDLVRRGHGFAVLPFSAIHTHIESDEICAAPLAGISVTWIIAHSIGRPLSSNARRMRELIIETTGRLIKQGTWIGARHPARQQAAERSRAEYPFYHGERGDV